MSPNVCSSEVDVTHTNRLRRPHRPRVFGGCRVWTYIAYADALPAIVPYVSKPTSISSSVQAVLTDILHHTVRHEVPNGFTVLSASAYIG